MKSKRKQQVHLIHPVNRLWAEYERAVFAGLEVSEIQHRETCAAFHAGMLAAFNYLTGPAVMGATDEEGCRRLDEFNELLQIACQAFTKIREQQRGQK